MPKVKTKSGAKKRFKVTGSGKVLYAQAGKRHGMIKRSKKQIRQLLAACRSFRFRYFSRRSAMARVKRGVTAHAKHKKVLKAAKGYYGRRKNTIRVAKQAVERANQYAYRDRKRRKRTFRALWIQRLHAAVRPFGLTYSRFIDGLGKAGVAVDRKVLSDLAIREPAAFEAIVGQAKAALAA